jgi:hypothetical protein
MTETRKRSFHLSKFKAKVGLRVREAAEKDYPAASA